MSKQKICDRIREQSQNLHTKSANKPSEKTSAKRTWHYHTTKYAGVAAWGSPKAIRFWGDQWLGVPRKFVKFLG